MGQLPGFTVLWPKMLWLLALVPVLAWLYWRMLRRGNRVAVRYPALELVGGAGPVRAWRRWVPAILLLLGLTSMVLAIARPQAVMSLPSRLENIVLAMDMSGSMRATDIRPSRIYAAQAAAKQFVAEQPLNVSVGVVAVAGAAAVVQSPSRQRERVEAAIDRLQPQRGTALGAGLIIALTTVLPDQDIDVERFMDGAPLPPPPNAAGEPVVPGSNPSSAVILLSDGESNSGPDPLKAAEVAAQYGVRIFTVGIGTPEGVTLEADGWSMRVRLDEATLKKIADTTGAQYFQADDAEGLKKIYSSLSTRLAFDKQRQVEISSLFAALGALLAGLSAMLSLWWFGRVQ
ncbi:VWA domain-containing protein [Pigmentiphaga soli]|uniref:VWA domain-containing protein n=1 Tax=Pigmentiphaga soli TaxID=1007095 RepID=A0ABP8HLW3_9BURK